jgi:hypothetical protein
VSYRFSEKSLAMDLLLVIKIREDSCNSFYEHQHIPIALVSGVHTVSLDEVNKLPAFHDVYFQQENCC